MTVPAVNTDKYFEFDLTFPGTSGTLHVNETLQISWDLNDASTDWVKPRNIRLHIVNATTDAIIQEISTGYTLSSGSATIDPLALIWTVPSHFVAGNYKLRAIDKANANLIYARSDAFEITATHVTTITSPALEDDVQIGNTKTVTWTSSGWGAAETADIYSRPVGSIVWTKLNTTSFLPASVSSFAWTPWTNYSAGEYELGIIETGLDVVEDNFSAISDVFSLVDKSITFTAPTDGQVLLVPSDDNTISWTPAGFGDSAIRLQYRSITDNVYGSWVDITQIAASAGTYAGWDIAEGTATGVYQVRAIDLKNNNKEYLGTSFYFQAKSITIISPTGGTLWKKQKAYYVTWTYEGYSGDESVTVSWAKSPYSSYSVVGMADSGVATMSDGTISFTLPNDTGAFKIKIATAGSSDVVSSAFTITDGAADFNSFERQTMLVAVSGGKVYAENTSTHVMTRVDGSGDASLATDRQPVVIPAFQKVFFADGDYEGFKIFDPVTYKVVGNMSVAGTFLMGTPLSFEAGGVEKAGGYGTVDRQIDGTSPSVTLYVYSLNAQVPVVGNTATAIGIDSAGDDVTITFTVTAVTAPPHFTDWSAKTGSMPDAATVGCLYRGRIVLCQGHIWYMSRAGDPFDWDYSQTDAMTAIAGSGTEIGIISDLITAAFEFQSDTMIFGTESALYIMRGDPAAGGSLDKLVVGDGIFSNTAWCFDGSGRLFFIGFGGLYVMESPMTMPRNLTQASNPLFMKGISRDTHMVTMVNDVRRHGLQIYITNIDSAGTDYGDCEAYWFDLRTLGLFPEVYPQDCGVFSAYYYNPGDSDYEALLLGGHDGKIRKVDDDATSDISSQGVAVAIDSYVFYAPKVLYQAGWEGKWTGLTVISDGDEDSNFNVELYSGDTVMDIMDATSATETVTITTDRFYRQLVSLRGQYGALKVTCPTVDKTFEVEVIIAAIDEGGRIRG